MRASIWIDIGLASARVEEMTTKEPSFAILPHHCRCLSAQARSNQKSLKSPYVLAFLARFDLGGAATTSPSASGLFLR